MDVTKKSPGYYKPGDYENTIALKNLPVKFNRENNVIKIGLRQ